MKLTFPRTWLSTVIATLALSVFAQAQLRELPLDGKFEEPPVLEASGHLLPEYLAGPHHKVTGTFTTYAGHNQYVVESEFGSATVDGSIALVQLVAEFEAIGKLRKVIGTKEYTDALAKAGESGSALVKQIGQSPTGTVDGVPNGPWKIMERAARPAPAKAAKETPEEKELADFFAVKEQIAAALSVDPYSANATLQRDLNTVAWAALGSGTKVEALLASVPTAKPAEGEEAAAAKPASSASQRTALQARLVKMGCTKEQAAAFVNHRSFTLTAERELIAALETLEGIAGRAEFVRLANAAADSSEAWFFVRCAQLLASVKSQVVLTRIISHRGLPMAVSEDGVAFVPMEWDYASWTKSAGEFMVSLKTETFKKDKVTGFHVLLTGVATDRFADELGQRDLGLSEKGLPCPVKKELKSGSVSKPETGLLAGK